MQQLCELHGVLLRYLPAYSPDFNPYWAVFSFVKTVDEKAFMGLACETGDETGLIVDVERLYSS